MKSEFSQKYLKPGSFYSYTVALGGTMGYALTQLPKYQQKEYIINNIVSLLFTLLLEYMQLLYLLDFLYLL